MLERQKTEDFKLLWQNMNIMFWNEVFKIMKHIYIP